MANRNSRIVIPMYAPSFDGRYWGRYPFGDKPVMGADLAADALAAAWATAAMATQIRLVAQAQGAASVAAGLSTAIRAAAVAPSVASATGNLTVGSDSTSQPVTWVAPTLRVDGSPLTNLAYYFLYRGTLAGGFAGSTFRNKILAGTTTYNDPTAPAGTIAYWVVAVDEDGTPSDPSNPILKVS